ncbi:NHL domain-containing protein [Comamonas odontotermitis]
MNSAIRKVNVADGTITTIAGTAEDGGFGGDGSAAANAQLFYPTAAKLDSQGNIYIADGGNNRIRKIDASTGAITTIVRTGINGYFGDKGLASQAQLYQPFDIAIDADDNLYIADSGN